MMGYLWVVGYIGTIIAANWTLQTFGLIPVGFGLLAPAGVLWAGLAFTLRDLTQDSLGRRWTVAAILAGAALSAFVSGPLALASGAAFLLSESLDFAVYTPLRARHWLGAVAASNTAGFVADSVVFLWLGSYALPFLSLAQLPGQLVGKLWMTVAAVGLLWLWRRREATAG